MIRGFAHVPTDRAGGGQDMPQIRRAVLLRRRTHGDELKQAEIHAAGHVRGEFEATRLDGALDQTRQTGFMDGHFSPLQTADPVAVDVDAKHIVCPSRPGTRQ